MVSAAFVPVIGTTGRVRQAFGGVRSVRNEPSTLGGPEGKAREAREQAQVAFAVGKRVGKAVVRNRVKRRLRAALRELPKELCPGAYLLSVKPEAARVGYAELRSDVSAVLDEVAARQGKPKVR